MPQQTIAWVYLVLLAVILVMTVLIYKNTSSKNSTSKRSRAPCPPGGTWSFQDGMGNTHSGIPCCSYTDAMGQEYKFYSEQGPTGIWVDRLRDNKTGLFCNAEGSPSDLKSYSYPQGWYWN